MINSLYIKNYRNLNELTISSLGRVNLITGKNNVGKSTILEAIALYASKGDLSILYQLLEERGEGFKRIEAGSNSAVQSNLKTVSSLFRNRTVNFAKDGAILIDDLENTSSVKELSNKHVSIRFIKYFDEEQKGLEGDIVRRRRIVSEKEVEQEFGNYKIGLEIKFGDNFSILPLEVDRPGRFARSLSV